MSETKTFDLGAVLSVTTERLLTDIGNLYGVLGWMTEDEPFTHQLPRFNDECKPWLLRWFPELAQADELIHMLDVEINADGAERGVKTWLSKLVELGFKASYDVPRIPRDDHERKNPLQELVDMVGPDKVVPIVLPSPLKGETEA